MLCVFPQQFISCLANDFRGSLISDIRNIGAMITPLHFLEVKLGKRPQPVKSELDEEEEQRKRRQEKNKVAAARCRNKKKEQKEFL
ncbi:hypothetical protein QTO34_007853 [Cnephaeus nilssonii]|uniref:BZIP domain-containing protein n=1 Tax=Cnephaeus nilssonii TaxID=3371016 RepID=A0AA40HJ46_CNENI|nr:hypothetical protein QTO34_007853 [Eptesicus nilssonii]